MSSGAAPAVDVAFFLCSVEAALESPLLSRRSRSMGRDQNRCFLGPFEGLEGRRASALLDLIRRHSPEALIDLHNNTGHSPAYGVGMQVDAARLGITALFADRYMNSDLELGTLTEALDDRVTSVVVECGRAGDPVADATALSGLERFVMLEDLGSARKGAASVEVLWRPVRVSVPEWVTLAFGDRAAADATLTVRQDVDRHNFSTMAAGEVVGWTPVDAPWPLVATGKTGEDVSRALFVRNGTELCTRREMVPVMMTTSPEIARSDCLFYALERRG
jgi:hypothetical protein